MPRPEPFLLTKIIATLGPASQSQQVIEEMILEGARGFRLNLSHGTLSEHTERVELVRAASKRLGIPVAVFADLCGPRIRIGQVCDGGIGLHTGQQVIILDRPITAQRPAREDQTVVISLNNPKVIEQVQVGHRVLIDDGSIRLICQTRQPGQISCTVQVGARLVSNKGVNLPDTDLDISPLTDRDYEHVRWAVEKGLDYIALSFVKSGQDVKILKDELVRCGARPSDDQLCIADPLQFSAVEIESEHIVPIISKIERPQAVANLQSILEQTDLVMVARGDLGVEMQLAEVPVIQKHIIRTCQDYGIPVIVATQMLQSMVDRPSPTRAEVSDVANAIFDGADAVMLSAETSVGSYPVEAVRMMNQIAQMTHQYIRQHQQVQPAQPRGPQTKRSASAIAAGARVIAGLKDVRLLAVWSRMGGGAVYLSQQRIPRPILAFSQAKGILQRLALLYGLRPTYLQQPNSLGQFLAELDRLCLENDWAKAGEPIVVVCSEPMTIQGLTNVVCIHYVGMSKDRIPLPCQSQGASRGTV